MGGLFSPNHILLILLIVILLFGGRKIPELMRGIGKGIREFNDNKDNTKKEIDESVNGKEHETTSTSSTRQ
jgi:sec-independent protein translocase protein TatA